MRFELEVDLEAIHRATSRHLAVCFTENYIRRFLKHNPRILGAIAVVTDGNLDTYEREWLCESISENCINMPICMNGSTDEIHKLWTKKWLEFITTSDKIDRKLSKEWLEKN